MGDNSWIEEKSATTLREKEEWVTTSQNGEVGNDFLLRREVGDDFLEQKYGFHILEKTKCRSPTRTKRYSSMDHLVYGRYMLPKS